MYYGDMMKPVRYSRGQIMEGLRYFVSMNFGREITREEKIEETPNVLRHACMEALITNLPMGTFPVPEMGLTVPFYFCPSCGKLLYYKDFM